VERLQAELAERVTEHRQTVERLLDDCDQLRRQIDSVHGSICWRITWPIRWLHKLGSRIRRPASRVLCLRNLVPRAKAAAVQRLPAHWANRLRRKPYLPRDPTLLVNSMYKAAFGRHVDPAGLAYWVQQLQSGVSLEALAKGLAASPEFQARHGSTQKVDTEFLHALYRDGLGRKPDPEGLAHWLSEGENGATRANVLAAFAGSIEKTSFPPCLRVAVSTESPPSALPGTDPAATRNEVLLGPVPRDAQIIEIGPSFNPIAPKADGWNTRTLDHMRREDLIAKYRGHPGVDVNRIEEVDFVWSGGSLIEAVPGPLHGTFDALIASHVIEHTPDLVDFLRTAEILLKSSGVVVLAIPDKRYCFDYFQPLSTTGQVLEAHAEGRSRHTRRAAFDEYAYAVKDGDAIAWGQHPPRGLSFIHAIKDAHNLCSSIESREDYFDLHNWRFTPSSFALIMLELARLGETDWRVERATPPNGCEFFAWLSRGGLAVASSLTEAELAAERLALLKRTLVETKTQIDWLLTNEPEA